MAQWLGCRGPLATLFLLAAMLLATGCAAQSRQGAAQAIEAQAPARPIRVVRHGWHSGIAEPLGDPGAVDEVGQQQDLIGMLRSAAAIFRSAP